MDKAKIVEAGASQLVELPVAYRFEQSEVRVRRHGRAVILEPIPADWTWLDMLPHDVDRDFEQAVAEMAPDQDRRAAGFDDRWGAEAHRANPP